ncbi:hypothetical protein [uncultured Aquimarina sp.]|uniref:hypothetical protein n=1 Tax=uncultured Aquimarina sp. TaxID=575652 RepID=UPI00261271BC|nr:hypothetical protein [uncultured Aquimarina sp.]
MNTTIKFKNFKTDEKLFVIGLTVWIFLQISRLIALQLINDINNDSESEAWMYPAYLDIFSAVLALPLIIVIIKWRGLLTWTATIVYLVISIVDHFGNFTTTSIVGPPSIVEEGMDPLLIPIIQTVVDFVFLILLLLPKYRILFFKIDKE